ncbi:MAG: hypothetical protein GY932_07340 [Arcobacter sp.]|nr:hypothetical protein [Arcobacter sp.]
MRHNSIIKLSEIISKEVSFDINEISFAIQEIEKLILKEEIREKITKKEISNNIDSCSTNYFNLNKYLDQIQKNITQLNTFNNILDEKKRLLDLDIVKNLNIINLIRL